MITKQQLADSMTRECDIAQHIFTKLKPGAFDYRPTPTQRSTVELLRYLSICGIAGTKAMAERNWKLFGERYVSRVKEMRADEFPDAMNLQKQELEEFFAGVDEQALRTQDAPMPGGASLPLGAAIVTGPLKWLAAYKMQLFLYAKANGATELSTWNAWRGVDAPPKA